jgi:hypothetical protein
MEADSEGTISGYMAASVFKDWGELSQAGIEANDTAMANAENARRIDHVLPGCRTNLLSDSGSLGSSFLNILLGLR